MATRKDRQAENSRRRRKIQAALPAESAGAVAGDEEQAQGPDPRLVHAMAAAQDLQARYGTASPRGALLPDSPWRPIYLEVLAATGVLIAAADAIGISRQAALQARAADPALEEAVQSALDQYRRVLHDEAHRRAVLGWDEPVFGGQFKDMVVGYVRKYDPRLLELMLKRHDPEFRVDKDRSVTVTGAVAHLHKHTLDMGALSPTDMDLVAKLLGTGDAVPDVTDGELVDDGMTDAGEGDVGAVGGAVGGGDSTGGDVGGGVV